MTNQRTGWIDLLRGFCMISILWFHTEFYYLGYAAIPYAYYVGDVLAIFFFLSGYLSYNTNYFTPMHIFSHFKLLLSTALVINTGKHIPQNTFKT